MARRHLVDFIKFCKPDYIVERFHLELCNIMEEFYYAVRARTAPRVVIVAPPQAGKSEIVSRFAPAWFFGRFVRDLQDGLVKTEDMQAFSGIFSTYADNWASDLCRDVERIMDSQEYAQVFPELSFRVGQDVVDEDGDVYEEEVEVAIPGARIPPRGSSGEGKRTQDYFELLNYPGVRYKAVGRGQAPAGRPANFIIIDDFLKGIEEAMSVTIRQKCWDSYGNDLTSRLQRGGGVICMHTRWSLDDLIGRILEDAEKRGELERWKVYVFPAIAPKGGCDWRKEGESLTPVRFPVKDWLDKMGPLSPAMRASLYDGRPVALTGNILPASAWRYYGGPGQPELPDLSQFDLIVQSWDLAFKDAMGSDNVAGQVWGWRGSECWLLPDGYILEQMSFPRTVHAFRAMHYQHPYSTWKFVEDAANGPAIISTLQGEIEGIIAIKPEGGKIARAQNAAAPLMAGNVFIPDPSIAPWVGAFVQRCHLFPANLNKAGSDDDVDAFTQMVAQRKHYQHGLLDVWKKQAEDQLRKQTADNKKPEISMELSPEDQEQLKNSILQQLHARSLNQLRGQGQMHSGMERRQTMPQREIPKAPAPMCGKCSSTALRFFGGRRECTVCGWTNF